MVPDANFTSYYGRPVVKPSPWTADIPAYLFMGGLAGGSSLLGAGADLSGRPMLRRGARLAALGALSGSFYALVHDLGRPARFHHMLRVAKATSPMSVGTWILTAYGPMAGLAAVSEATPFLSRRMRRSVLGRRLPTVGRAAGLVAAGLGPAVASYTAVLLADTATPTWHAARRDLPLVFVGSASAAAGGMGLILASPQEAGPARRMAIAGAALDLAASHTMESGMGVTVEPLHEGRAGTLLKAAKAFTTAGAALAAVGRRRRDVSALAGVSLLAGSVCTRFGLFEAGQQSARDPRYTVVPQRERLDQHARAHTPG
ncbi:Polysulphide reductase, NrfD [Modestobacter sp. DSM 44400]|nr:Polysulphide reductase, NrfD [Modestobacter sp. DSM 44400]